MKGLILAAGRGRRMQEVTDNKHKSQVEIFGKSMMRWQLDALHEAGIEDIAVVCGYKQETLDFNGKRFENKNWDRTNMVCSLLEAKEWLEDDECIVSYSDIAYTADDVVGLSQHAGDICLAYDRDWLELWTLRFKDPLDDAECFRMEGSKIIEIGGRAKRVEEIEGQYIGLIKLSTKGWKRMREFLALIEDNRLKQLDMTGLFSEMLEESIEIQGYELKNRWYEVDSKEDLEVYRNVKSGDNWRKKGVGMNYNI